MSNRQHYIRNGAIRWQISKSVKDIKHIFVLGFTTSELLAFQMFDLENLCQGHGE